MALLHDESAPQLLTWQQTLDRKIRKACPTVRVRTLPRGGREYRLGPFAVQLPPRAAPNPRVERSVTGDVDVAIRRWGTYKAKLEDEQASLLRYAEERARVEAPLGPLEPVAAVEREGAPVTGPELPEPELPEGFGEELPDVPEVPDVAELELSALSPDQEVPPVPIGPTTTKCPYCAFKAAVPRGLKRHLSHNSSRHGHPKQAPFKPLKKGQQLKKDRAAALVEALASAPARTPAPRATRATATHSAPRIIKGAAVDGNRSLTGLVELAAGLTEFAARFATALESYVAEVGVKDLEVRQRLARGEELEELFQSMRLKFEAKPAGPKPYVFQ